MKIRIQWLAAILLITLSCQVIAADYPMFSAYPGAKVEGNLMIDYEQVTLPTSIAKNNKFTSLELKGDLYKHTYLIKNVSTLKIFENYSEAAKKAGFTMLFSFTPETCDWRECSSSIGNLMSIEGNIYKYSRNPYYWIGEKISSKGKIVVAWYIGSFDEIVYVHQAIVETEPLENNLIQIHADYANAIPDAIAPKELTAAEKAKDHSLLPRYPGAIASNQTKADTETFRFPFAINSLGKTPLSVTGDLARHYYVINNVSTLKVYENYKQALMKAGFTFISQCELDECGDYTEVTALGDQLALGGSIYKYTRKPYYILAKKSIDEANKANTYVALIIAGFDDTVHVHQVILEEKAVVTGLVTVNADMLKQQIDENGKALIYGIYFDTGKATIKPESKPTLDAIAELLKRNPDLLLYVVGHTDDTGSVALNLTLSQQRAKSVRDALITDYQIVAARLQAEGVGPYAPASNNTSDSGKQKNRRVELVKRLQ
jgi:outer membrane protein OmpA-like peptidoglycan-associated protein